MRIEKIEKINKTKSWFFKKINKIDKPLPTQTKKKEKTQITTIRNGSGNITTDSREIKRIIRVLCKQIRQNGQIPKNKTYQD